MFNAFNISNLIFGSYTLDSAYSTSQAFGQAVARLARAWAKAAREQCS